MVKSYNNQEEGVKMSYIEIKDLTKTYHMGDVEIKALDGVSVEIEKGELVVIVGASGAGKTTLLNILGGMDHPTSGELVVDGKCISSYSRKGLTKYRREDVGFVFQFYNLIPNITALENVEMACEVVKKPFSARETLKSVGLDGREDSFPSQLSGGQQQRVSIARALAKNPKLLLCDEPTGALDYQTGKAILSLLQSMCKTYQMSVVIITHNQAITPIASRVIRMKNGLVDQHYINKSPVSVEEIEW